MLISHKIHNDIIKAVAEALKIILDLVENKKSPLPYNGALRLIRISAADSKRPAVRKLEVAYGSDLYNRPIWLKHGEEGDKSTEKFSAAIEKMCTGYPVIEFKPIKSSLYDYIRLLLECENRLLSASDYLVLFKSGFFPLFLLGNSVVVTNYISRPGKIAPNCRGHKSELFSTLAPNRQPIDRLNRWSFDKPVQPASGWTAFLEMPVEQAVRAILAHYTHGDPSGQPVINDLARLAKRVSVKSQYLQIDFLGSFRGEETDGRLKLFPPYLDDASGLPPSVVSILRAYNRAEFDGIESFTWNAYLGPNKGFKIDWSVWNAVYDDVTDDLWKDKPLVPISTQDLWAYHPARVENDFLQLMFVSHGSGHATRYCIQHPGMVFLMLMRAQLTDIEIPE
ncbi:hypothetical protein LBMAG53_23650 [Planctomycetota bacterium]|nr:hypothetical protein LBMAG53_23650 [Planctomycetota bacterium]